MINTQTLTVDGSRQEELTEKQLLLLNNLIYREEIFDTDGRKNSIKTVGELVEKKVYSESATLQEKEWKALYDMARNDPQIANLRIVNPYRETETGAKMACFVTPEGQAYAVYAGTGANEWHDDFIAGERVSTIQQEKALDWMESLPYDDIIVSGHSKGGNKAMYVTILSDKIKTCYAFDGEGFSQEFIDHYQDRIAAKTDSIHLIASYRDFVNPLMYSIAGHKTFVVNDHGVDNPGEYHAPDVLFKHDENGNLLYELGEGDETTQEPAMEMIGDFSRYLIKHATPAERILVLSVLGQYATDFLGGENKKVRQDVLDTFSKEGIDILLRHFSKYLKMIKNTDPKKYALYKVSLKNFAVEGSIKNSLLRLGIDGIAFKSVDGIFDILEDGRINTLYTFVQGIVDGNIQGRDFTIATKERLIEAAKEVEDESWWDVTKWDCWYRVERFYGHLKLDYYAASVDRYYQKLIDVNGASIKDIERIFTEVYTIDDTTAATIDGHIQALNTEVIGKLTGIKNSIQPVASR